MAFYTMFDHCIKGQVSEPYGLYYNKTENGIKREIWHSPPKRYPFRVPNCILLENWFDEISKIFENTRYLQGKILKRGLTIQILSCIMQITNVFGLFYNQRLGTLNPWKRQKMVSGHWTNWQIVVVQFYYLSIKSVFMYYNDGRPPPSTMVDNRPSTDLE